MSGYKKIVHINVWNGDFSEWRSQPIALYTEKGLKANQKIGGIYQESGILGFSENYRIHYVILSCME
ncbi:MAG: hypothetical protein A4E36_00571 [Methanoregulaceae archaeon PtaB.Bin009]|jgi:hypothetical protein|nr:MAG: hypothetical protein A4E36_00571 [Methanoregulaceae archaeon PtaB.Bin009]OPY39628.1 MAG: hypothetical protein A4E41_01647 [Methanoregulaceae archaeon PtaU1.Bin066]